MANTSVQDLLRKLPGVDALLQLEPLREALTQHPRKLLLESIRHVLEEQRQRILDPKGSGASVNLEPSHLVQLILQRLVQVSDYALRPVINATGIVIHTNLGRSLLPQEAIERLALLCRSYNNLEYDLEKGKRGSRYVHAEAILCELTGAEAALVVNNNAGAVFLVLNTLAQGKEVIVSRGQLVEIGGSFRIPDVMRSSGAILREVGCTNRTHARDYEGAINGETALLMKVHTSNYRIVGFSSEVSLEELTALGRTHGLLVIEDLGSGSFINFAPFGLQGEPTVQETVRGGADVVTFSGDKLLGGPQAGIILGRKSLIEKCKKNPLTRALRVDKMTLAVLEGTLRLYRDERLAMEQIPTLRMIATPLSVLEERAAKLAAMISGADAHSIFEVTVEPNASQVGGGSLPAQNLPTFVVAVRSERLSTQKVELFMRNYTPPLIGRIESDRFLMDARTLQDDEFTVIQQAFKSLLATIVTD
ncbi:L-seryl-tRNA(Sec) selenium transferase [Desulforhabdus sp. TSK]|uniref:L-seryl-tRNA(Sec) selenium transferase n=1 Tax=Desulforhabdus sp. TSK TaxID=2925014 RepID=UPI001FC803AF|nr:L-seryl-tRNA(Sec) selenium transferase [Desulforhabdus sp. TSK]GKT08250.1 L-seryl-tRNA(Sec) selenium transferase [Desulforhabdus sp. TSK]